MKITRRELLTAASLAAASRALKGYNDDLAQRSLKAAIAIYDRATPQEELARVGAAVDEQPAVTGVER